MSNSSRLVPGGGLTAHENAGGHTLARHVGQTEAQLASRLATQPHIPRASSFRDRTIAEAAISEAIDVNQAAITAWLSGSRLRLQLNPYTASSQVGVSLERGATNLIPAQKVQAILLRDSHLSLGYYILTAYPDP